MNLVFAGLVTLLSLLFIKKTIDRTRNVTLSDERTELVGLKASRAVFSIFTTTCALSSFFLIFFGRYGRVPSDYVYYIGVITSYLTCLLLVLYSILYAYYNRQS